MLMWEKIMTKTLWETLTMVWKRDADVTNSELVLFLIKKNGEFKGGMNYEVKVDD